MIICESMLDLLTVPSRPLLLISASSSPIFPSSSSKEEESISQLMSRQTVCRYSEISAGRSESLNLMFISSASLSALSECESLGVKRYAPPLVISWRVPF